jgi:hypothetical protein
LRCDDVTQVFGPNRLACCQIFQIPGIRFISDGLKVIVGIENDKTDRFTQIVGITEEVAVEIFGADVQKEIANHFSFGIINFSDVGNNTLTGVVQLVVGINGIDEVVRTEKKASSVSSSKKLAILASSAILERGQNPGHSVGMIVVSRSIV